MRKHHALFMAVSLATGGLTLPLLAADDATQAPAQPPVRQPMQADKPAQPGQHHLQGKLPQGVKITEADDAEDIRDTLADATEAALNKDDLEDFVDYFVDADRNRIGDWEVATKDDTLKGRIAQIQKAWNEKYNRSVNINAETAFGPGYQGFVIVQGEITNPALLSDWPVPNEQADLQGQRLDRTDRPGNEPGDRNLEQGRDVAVVTFPAGHGLPAVNVSLIDEAFGWKIDVPDSVSGQQLRDNLLLHLTRFGEMHQQWPADAKQAQQLLAHHVMAAVYNLKPQAGQQQDRPLKLSDQPDPLKQGQDQLKQQREQEQNRILGQ